MEEDDLGLLESILSHANLLEFLSYSACSEAKLDARIVKCLTKSELFEGVDAADIWTFRLRMALQLNRTDFLREKMFAGVDWSMVPADFVEISLLEDKREFLQMLLESGFPLPKYINLDLILRLYQADYRSDAHVISCNIDLADFAVFVQFSVGLSEEVIHTPKPV
ncbi:unnamed protein product [Dibothriocephalus latus]|uniref:Uncharacterized protein n=1 Tax=Dibothriocephalus latus TaxID=60516 RepID=A0A3P7LX40_DIBLA|nr:unnamed protein product [Dibothriocephalus latus]